MPAWAQTTPIPQQAADQDTSSVDDIVVTGSNIRGTSLTASLPVEVYSVEELENRGSPTALEFAKTLTVSGPTTGESYYFGGPTLIGSVNFNLRGMVLDENSFDLPLPALTLGIHFKYNDSIDKINHNLGGALKSIGYKDDFGIDYTVTASKTFGKLAFGRPVILTGGMRLSKAAQIGLLGFGDDYRATFEGSVAYLPIDPLCLAYEYRMKRNPYHQISGLIEDEDDWHAFSATWIINDNLTLTGVMGLLGNVVNARENCMLVMQLRYEF